MKDSDHLVTALEALKAGKYSFAISELRLVLTDRPAATTGGEERDVAFAAELWNMSLQAQWLIMITQRLNGEFGVAEETFWLMGRQFEAVTVPHLYTDNLGEILLSQALDGETSDLIQQMLDQSL
jgi:hypothetical protein